MTIDLTPVVHAMAAAQIDPDSPTTFERLGKMVQREIKQEMLDALLPALPVLEAQVRAAVEYELTLKEVHT